MIWTSVSSGGVDPLRFSSPGSMHLYTRNLPLWFPLLTNFINMLIVISSRTLALPTLTEVSISGLGTMESPWLAVWQTNPSSFQNIYRADWTHKRKGKLSEHWCRNRIEGSSNRALSDTHVSRVNFDPEEVSYMKAATAAAIIQKNPTTYLQFLFRHHLSFS